MVVMSLSEHVRMARALSGISARELDRLANLAEGHTSLIENGSRPNVEARTAAAIAQVLGVSLDWLVSGEGKAPTERGVKAAVEAARAKSSPKPAA